VALGTLGLVAFTATLWWATRKLVKGADETASRQLRAYVGIDRMELDTRNLANAHYKPHEPKAGTRSPDAIIATIRNFGTTPANSVHVWINWGGMPFAERLPTDFPYPNYDSVTVGGPTGLRPTWTRPALFPNQVTEQPAFVNDLSGFIGAARGALTMYVWGTISYIDMFKEHRETDFCFSFDPGAVLGKRFVAYEEHNEAR
jgi:hypothetical protein